MSCVATSLNRRKLVVQAYSQIFWRSGIKLCLIDNACSNRSRRARVAKSKRCQLPSLTVCANRDPHDTNFVGTSCDLSLRIQSILGAKFAYSKIFASFHCFTYGAGFLGQYLCRWKSAMASFGRTHRFAPTACVFVFLRLVGAGFACPTGIAFG